MPHIHTEPGQHDHTASAFIVRLDQDEPKILLHIHKLLGKYLQFGGHIELDENPWQAVKHEVKEESGYDISQLKILQPKFYKKISASDVKAHPFPVYHNTHSFSDDHWHTDVCYVFVTREDPRSKVDESESGELRLFTRDEIANLTTKETYDNLKQSCLFVFDECLPNWEEVSPSEFD